jgi:hypothetical protein
MEYAEVIQIRPKGSIYWYWSDHHNWKMRHIVRLARQMKKVGRRSQSGRSSAQ